MLLTVTGPVAVIEPVAVTDPAAKMEPVALIGLLAVMGPLIVAVVSGALIAVVGMFKSINARNIATANRNVTASAHAVQITFAL
jgi:hypothetical protein